MPIFRARCASIISCSATYLNADLRLLLSAKSLRRIRKMRLSRRQYLGFFLRQVRTRSVFWVPLKYFRPPLFLSHLFLALICLISAHEGLEQ